MHFVQLTHFNTLGDASMCVVNIELVTNIITWEMRWTKYPPLEPGQMVVKPIRGTQLVTCLSFAAGLGEESDSINVLETINEIMALIPEQGI